MKKFLILLLFLTLVCCSLFSQEAVVSNSASGRVETIKWEAVDNAAKYQLKIERLNDDGNWVNHKTVNVTKTIYNATLEPGEYRVSITAMNILGRKGTPSDWIHFMVISEEIPFFYKNSFKKLNEWNSPVLYLSRTDNDKTKFPDYKKSIIAPAGYEENSFHIRGRNIFYSGTQFYLEPIDESFDGGKTFVNPGRPRERVELSVLKRESKKFNIYLSYDSSKLYSGYYKIVAENPGGNKAEQSILVLVDEKLEIKNADLEIDELYKFHSYEITGEIGEFTIEMAGATGYTSLSLVQTMEYTYYPFDSHKAIPACKLTEKSRVYNPENDTYRITVQFDTENLVTGFYNIAGENSGRQTAYARTEYLIHCRKPIANLEEEAPETYSSVKKLSSKYIKKSKTVRITVTGKGLKTSYKYTLVHRYNKVQASNKKIVLNFEEQNENKLVCYVPVTDLEFGDYGLQVDDDKQTCVYTYELDNYFKFSQKNMKPQVFQKTFFRQEDDAQNVEPDLESLRIESNKLLKVMVPVFMPNARFFLAMDPSNSDSSISTLDVKLNVDMLNFGWFSLNPGIQVVFGTTHYEAGDDSFDSEFIDYAARLDMRFMVPGKYFSPYFGLGAGYKFVNYGYFCGFENLLKPECLVRNDLFAEAQLGMTLFSFLDMNYALEMHNLLSPEKKFYFKDRLNIGIRIPIRQNYYKFVETSKKYCFVNQSSINGSNYAINEPLFTIASFGEGVEEVEGFSSIKQLEKIEIYGSVTEIKDDAFSNCEKLQTVTISKYTTLEVIGERAFQNDTNIRTIIIPATIKSIEKDAFAGWTKKQKIILDWNGEIPVERNLEGLKNTQAVIEYSNHTPFDYASLNQTKGDK